MQPLAKPDGGQFAPGDVEGVAHIGKLQRHRNVFQRGHVGDQMEGLEDDANVAAAKIRQRILAKPMQGRAVDMDFAGIEPFQPGQHHQQRRFSRSRRPDDADGFTRIDTEVDPLEHMDRGGVAPQRQIGPLQRDDGVRQDKPSYIGGGCWGRSRPR